MASSLYRYLVNTVYMTSAAVSRYRKKHPDEKVVAAGGCKARKISEDSEVRSDAGWAVARRGNVILTDRNLVCGDWVLPVASVSEAVLLRIRSFFAKAYVLKIRVSDGEYYLFGLQYDPKWESQNVLPLTIEDAKVKLSPLSLALRLVFMISMIWYFLKVSGILD